jgi:hypothetical protein
MRRSIVLLLALALALTTAVPAMAGSLAGVDMPNRVDVGDGQLVLNGMALRKKFIIKVYVAGLYLPQKQTNASRVLSGDTARQVRMEFLYGVSQDQMCEAWNEGLEANTPNASAAVKQGIERVCSFMEDADKGDTYTFTYVPGEGTTVAFNGRTKGTVPGKAVADALFASWIGPNPGPGEEFREDLMGN